MSSIRTTFRNVVVAARALLAARIGRFLVAGGTSALVNLGLLHVLIAWVGWSGGWFEDLANLGALEGSLLFQFGLCRRWVWAEGQDRAGPWWRALVAFHGAVAATSAGRAVLFSLLRQAGLHYLPNAVLGIALAAGLNYLLYDRVVFARR